MTEDFLYPHEFALVIAWLCAPAVIVAAPVLSWVLARRGLFGRGRRIRVSARIALGVIATLGLSVPLWLSLPTFLIPSGIGGHLVPPFFLPAFLSALIVMPCIYWWVLRNDGKKNRVPSA